MADYQREVHEARKQLDELNQKLQMILDDQEKNRRAMNYRLDVGEARDAWQVAEEDNVDGSNGLLVDVYIPPNGVTRSIKQVLVRIRLKAFRSYSAVTAAGGGTTATSASGGGGTSGASSTTTTVNNSTSFVVDYGSFLQSFGTSTFGSHDHAGAVAVDGSHSHAIADHYHPHSHNMEHTHTLTAHTHDVTLPDHTHNITAAITLGATASGCTIVINGTDRTTALTGAATFSVDKDELDVTQYMTATGYNTIQITSAGIGRIRCTAFVNLYLNNR